MRLMEVRIWGAWRLAPGVFVKTGFNVDHDLSESDLRMIGPLANGEYLVALIVNGVRCSNVASFAINAQYEPKNEPTLKLACL